MVFRPDGDRWSHQLLIDGTPCWQSVEGVPSLPKGMVPGLSERWPASAVVTEVSRIEIAAGPALLAVGRAGRSHFSLSVAATEDDRLLFELACRLHEPPGWLGSVYRPLTAAGSVDPLADWHAISPAGVATAGVPATITWAYEFTPARIEACPPASCGRLVFPSD